MRCSDRTCGLWKAEAERGKYYADEVERHRWLEEWPEDPLPEPEKPLYDRDRRLPHSEMRDGDEVM